jgi:hypothetical protein
MSIKTDIVQYKVCIKCNIGLSKFNENFCKYCKPRKSSNKSVIDTKRKIFLHNFDNIKTTPNKRKIGRLFSSNYMS